ncbi:hypothetical protein GDO78_001145 [Eleutherodactylus coqui]|uniref:Uncharacterized protein n=1 Tax=Eleutherodactylus coqui TaxID=57060 RepID=A0A8J6FSA6_ELECQ|nr:hypothetical protein GDO78_001145 [Eleutherodactylus coqui]
MQTQKSHIRYLLQCARTSVKIVKWEGIRPQNGSTTSEGGQSQIMMIPTESRSIIGESGIMLSLCQLDRLAPTKSQLEKT